MLLHVGPGRDFQHNFRLAVLLCLNAGFINSAGFIAFAVLTTNITGHAALLAIHLASGKLHAARMVVLWLVLFLSGAIASSFYIRKTGDDKKYSYTIPISVIIMILVVIMIFGKHYDHSLLQTGYFAGALLFAMGIQNALVTIVSGSVVRTTHLTGMFTDLGIDISTALLSGKKTDVTLKKQITLRLSIVSFFLLGGIIGGFLFYHFSFRSFVVPVALLCIALFYDYFRVSLIWIKRYQKSH